MNKQLYLFTSESVSEGHPDKIADCISDAVLDEFLKLDVLSRVAVETLVTTNKVVIAGEVRSNKVVSHNYLNQVIKDVVKDIGYDQVGFSYKNLHIDNYMHEQSVDIAMGVDATATKEEGAGDQGIMFGYACNETKELMPAAIYYAHKILEVLSKKRKQGELEFLLPDAKSQITLEYENHIPKRIHTVVLSHQHKGSVTQEQIKARLMPIFAEVFPNSLYDTKNVIHHINPTGRFLIGGPDGDTGLTGRKIIVDTYGGSAPHGGGAFSGKDPTKVDRSAAYVARYLAKNIVASGIASRCTLQLSYAIGIAKPTSIYINLHNTGQVDENEIVKLIPQMIDLSPQGIRTHLKLNNPIYKITSSYGHFGRISDDVHFTWEKLDLVTSFKNYFKI